MTTVDTALTGSGGGGSKLFLPLAVLATGVVAGLVVAVWETPLIAVVVAAGALLLAIAATPALAAWSWFLTAPLIVGVARTEGPLPIRPNEALLLIMIMGVGLAGLAHKVRGRGFLPKVGAVDLAIALLVLAGSVLPLIWRYGRDLELTNEDVLYALVFIKYALLYAVVRVAVRTPEQVKTALRLVIVSGAIVAIVAILQVTGLFSVAELLHAYYDSPFEGMEGPSTLRATSTLASAFGLADMLAICLALTVIQFVRRAEHRWLLAPAALLFLAGCVAAGSFSGIIGCAAAVLAAGYVMRRLLIQVALFAPAGLAAGVAFWPVIESRLAGFDRLDALPRSWIGRLNNLENFFWPELFSGFNWLLGVRPAARLPAPETWRDWVYIESGHTWLLWTGGVPLFLAFLLFFWLVLRTTRRTADIDPGPVGSAAGATFAGATMIFVLMLFDPHLTVRGSADLFFPLLALALVERVNDSTTRSRGILRLHTEFHPAAGS